MLSRLKRLLLPCEVGRETQLLSPALLGGGPPPTTGDDQPPPPPPVPPGWSNSPDWCKLSCRCPEDQPAGHGLAARSCRSPPLLPPLPPPVLPLPRGGAAS
jgi:hypothetical protein